ncbi:tetratricopeptide repeat protein [Marivirga sp.]|uniref:tetratricopeptide repeat protein n=1 Tax=Marivirga sp. TaxID=2018662 RepID=UPI002D8069AA|nr:tetratricopeptide repeat protein [Marivirga sp.]HET8859244.1 tetratricopeptide repeat protein [Marivirga sp.]
MDKQRLTTLINQPEKLEEKDFRYLTNLRQEYPYFQAISPLITIGSKKYAPNSEKKNLQSAAIYALDRKHLKEILTKDYNSNSSEKFNEEPQKNKVINNENNKVVGSSIVEKLPLKNKIQSNSKIDITPTASSSNLPDSFFEELFKEMEALKVEKENYRRTLDRFEANNSTITKEIISISTQFENGKKTSSKPKSSSSKKTKTSRKSESNKSSSDITKVNTKKSVSKKVEKKKKSSEKILKTEDHDIIEELASRKELKISDAHKKEQLNIINNFIEKEPILTKRINTDNQANKQEAEDLSASSTNLSDDVVSETLAKLMIKQGRKQKAIDIYKKLIWKFPQKKTYFVEIIEELKKES